MLFHMFLLLLFVLSVVAGVSVCCCSTVCLTLYCKLCCILPTVVVFVLPIVAVNDVVGFLIDVQSGVDVPTVVNLPVVAVNDVVGFPVDVQSGVNLPVVVVVVLLFYLLYCCC
jgi:hypothetical protein